MRGHLQYADLFMDRDAFNLRTSFIVRLGSDATKKIDNYEFKN